MKQSDTPRVDELHDYLNSNDDIGPVECFVTMANLARTLERRNAELERAIENAPHGRYCERLPDIIDEKHPLDESKCNCWKAAIKRRGEL